MANASGDVNADSAQSRVRAAGNYCILVRRARGRSVHGRAAGSTCHVRTHGDHSDSAV